MALFKHIFLYSILITGCTFCCAQTKIITGDVATVKTILAQTIFDYQPKRLIAKNTIQLIKKGTFVLTGGGTAIMWM